MVCKKVNLAIVSSNCASVSVFFNIDLCLFLYILFFGSILTHSIRILRYVIIIFYRSFINVFINIAYNLFIDFY